jgi:hypothetical protein
MIAEDVRGHFCAPFHSTVSNGLNKGEELNEAVQDDQSFSCEILPGSSEGKLLLAWLSDAKQTLTGIAPCLKSNREIASDYRRRGAKEHNSPRTPVVACDFAIFHSARIDWNLVLAQAARHRVRPLLFAKLSGASAGSIPPDVLTQLKDFTAANARRNLFLIGELLRLLDLLQSHGIPAAPFKGPILASAAYGSTALREAGDLDLLVRRRDIVAAKRLLAAHGFSPAFPTASEKEAAWLQSLAGRREISYLTQHCEHHMVGRQGLVNVDLHWALALREFWLPVKEREVWGWLTSQKFAGRVVSGFAAEEMLLVLCINGAKDCWERLDRICDVAQLLARHPDMDWRRVFARAARFGGVRMVCLGLRLAADLLGAMLAPSALVRIAADGTIPGMSRQVRDRLFAKQRGQVESADAGKSIFHLAMRERLHDRIGYCLAHLEPTVGDWAALPLPKGLGWLHYVMRPLRLMCRFR